MKLKDLFESPQYTFPQDFNLDDQDFNNAQAIKLLKNNKKRAVKQIGEYTLWEFPRAYALIKNDPTELAYVVKFQLDYFNKLKRQCVSQVIVWKDIGAPESRNLATDIFFNYLLPTTKTIITDTMQTPDGKRFWWNRILDAFEKGLHVYFINLTPPNQFVEVKSPDELKKIDRDAWGDHQRYQAARVIITSQPFDKGFLTGNE